MEKIIKSHNIKFEHLFKRFIYSIIIIFLFSFLLSTVGLKKGRDVEFLDVFGFIMICYVIVFIFSQRLIRVIFKQSGNVFFVEFVFRRFFFLNTSYVNINKNFSYSFKDSSSSRGLNKRKELKIYHKDKLIYNSSGGMEGWSENDILELIYDLEKYSIESV